MMHPLYVFLGIIAWLAFGFFGSGFFWKLIVAKHEGPMPGAALAFGTVFWPVAWPIALFMWALIIGLDLCEALTRGYIKWTGRPLLRKQTKDISA